MSMSISSNATQMATNMIGAGQVFAGKVDKAVGEAAKTFLRDCIIEIDAMIYSQPASDAYKRTKNLRRRHHIRRIVDGVWMVFNDAMDDDGNGYAVPVHDGWANSKGGHMPARPWMETAGRKNEKKYKNIIADELKDAFGS